MPNAFAAASMLSRLWPSACACSASSMYGVSSRLTTKPGSAAARQRQLADSRDERHRSQHRRFRRLLATNDLDERQARHGIEEVEADESARLARGRRPKSRAECSRYWSRSTPCAGKRGSSSPNSARFASAFSTMASITRSAEPIFRCREIDAQTCRGGLGLAWRTQTFAKQLARARQRRLDDTVAHGPAASRRAP